MPRPLAVAVLSALLLAACSSAPPSPATILAPVAPLAPPLLQGLFQDHAVLQRDRPIPVWGNASPGTVITLSLAGETAAATADEAGRWQAVLAPLPAGGPYTLTAQSNGGAAQAVKDVLIGDTYLCSGQSNIEWPVRMAMHGDSDAARSANDQIRLFTVRRFASAVPRSSFGASANWAAAAPDPVRDFSAVCYFFGRSLQPQAKVPLGLISAVWGGSTIQTWIGTDALRGQGNYDAQLDILADHSINPEAAANRWRLITNAWWLAHDPASRGAAPWHGLDYDDASWATILPTGSWKDWDVPALRNFDGIVWFRKAFDLTAEQAKGPAALALGPIDQVDTTWLNGTELGSNEGWNTPRNYTIPAGGLHPGRNVIAVGVLGGDGMWGPANERRLKFSDNSMIALDTPWHYRVSVPAALTGSMPHTPWLNEIGLTMLYNGMIAPLGPTPLKGILWYQGEGNTGEAARYGSLLKGLIADWRRQFGNQAAFYIAQLPGYGPAVTAPQPSSWAALREQQRLVADKTPNAGLAVTIDLGDRANLHPVVKQEVGRRLALLAERGVYGLPVTDSGPTPVAAIRKGSTLHIRFRNLAGGFAVYGSDRVVGFALCDHGGHCRFADGKTGKDEVTIELRQTDDVASIQFCWADSPVCNLYNSEGLPAVPFQIAVGSTTHQRKLKQ